MPKTVVHLFAFFFWSFAPAHAKTEAASQPDASIPRKLPSQKMKSATTGTTSAPSYSPNPVPLLDPPIPPAEAQQMAPSPPPPPTVEPQPLPVFSAPPTEMKSSEVKKETFASSMKETKESPKPKSDKKEEPLAETRKAKLESTAKEEPAWAGPLFHHFFYSRMRLAQTSLIQSDGDFYTLKFAWTPEITVANWTTLGVEFGMTFLKSLAEEWTASLDFIAVGRILSVPYVQPEIDLGMKYVMATDDVAPVFGFKGIYTFPSLWFDCLDHVFLGFNLMHFSNAWTTEISVGVGITFDRRIAP